MAKRRIYDIAKEKGLTNQELVDLLRAAGLEVKGSVSTVEEADVERVLSAAVKPDTKKAEAVEEAKPPLQQPRHPRRPV